MNGIYPYSAAWLAALPDLHGRLQRAPPARIADMGCADGSFSIALAQCYPRVHIDGFDLDEAIIDLAWSKAHDAGLTDRLTFHVRDVSEATLNGRYDLCIAHDRVTGMQNPMGVLATMRRLAGAKGSVLITVPSSVEPAGAANLVRSHALTVGFHTVEQVAIDAFCLHCYQLYQ